MNKSKTGQDNKGLSFNMLKIAFGTDGMEIGTSLYQQNVTFMKKSIEKFINTSLKKIWRQKERIKKLKFSAYPEDFVITEQEEREGGFFGNVHYKMLSTIK